jgi:hypothetical protein
MGVIDGLLTQVSQTEQKYSTAMQVNQGMLARDAPTPPLQARQDVHRY